LSKGTAEDPNDPLITPLESEFTPTLGAGAYWYGSNWYLGLSALNLLHTNHFNGEITDRPHYYFIGGYVFRINREFKFKPAILTKIVGGAPISINASANFLYNETFTFGLAYNNGQSLSAVVSADLNPVFSVGYSFDYSLKSLNQFSGGSHEIVLSYRFTKSSKAHRCHTRFF
jgi:type IX secretion system PorP/SprF family membrane protein